MFKKKYQKKNQKKILQFVQVKQKVALYVTIQTGVYIDREQLNSIHKI